MTLFWIKTLIATLLLIAGVTAATAMLRLMGKSEAPADPLRLRRIHKFSGRAVGVCLLALSLIGLFYWTKKGDQVPPRAVFHVYFALALDAVFILKLAIVKVYRQFLRLAPALGFTITVMLLVLVTSSAGYFLLRTAQMEASPSSLPVAASEATGDVGRGRTIFVRTCAGCHFADREDRSTGPGLKGLLRKPTLPATGRPATVENILCQLQTPYLAMPAFLSLSGQDTSDLVAYLKTL